MEVKVRSLSSGSGQGLTSSSSKEPLPPGMQPFPLGPLPPSQGHKTEEIDFWDLRSWKTPYKPKTKPTRAQVGQIAKLSQKVSGAVFIYIYVYRYNHSETSI